MDFAKRVIPSDFELFFDESLSLPTPYNFRNDYVAKAQDRMDRTFDLIKEDVAGRIILDVGASPFYLLHRAGKAGARECHGIYFAYDTHPLKGTDRIFSRGGPISIGHANIETENLPFPDDSIDVLTACEILEHCEHFPLRFATEIRRVLRPGGLVCFTVPNICSIANITKLLLQKNIYMKYRADPTGRHKHEYTLSQLKTLGRFIGLDVVKAGYMPSPTSDLYWLRPAYRAIAATPGLRMYSPVAYIVGRQPSPKPQGELGPPPSELYDYSLSIEG